MPVTHKRPDASAADAMLSQGLPRWASEIIAFSAQRDVSVGASLARTTNLLRLAGLDVSAPEFPAVVHVVGTNGKGSVAALVAAGLQGAGIAAGVFTSPHLHHLGERVRYCGTEFSDAELETAVLRIWKLAVPVTSVAAGGSSGDVVQSRRGEAPAAERQIQPESLDGRTQDEPDPAQIPSLFEVLLVAAVDLFCRAGAEVLVVEAGIGGASDATSCLNGQLAVLTSVSIDHASKLGSTREAIAADKAGVLTSGTLVLSRAIPAPLRDWICSRLPPAVAPRVAAELWEERAHAPTAERRCFRRDDSPTIPMAFEGQHQIDNLGAALEVLAALSNRFPQAWPPNPEALAAARWPGRLERFLHAGKSWILDVAHNEEGLQAVASHLGFAHDRLVIFGAAADKDWLRVVAIVPALGDQLLATSGFYRAADAEKLAAAVRGEAGIGDSAQIRTANSVAEALAQAAGGSEPEIVVVGSVFLVAEVRAWLLEQRQGPERSQASARGDAGEKAIKSGELDQGAEQTAEELQSLLAAFPKFLSEPGDPTERLAPLLESARRAPPRNVIHVVGSHGKGTTARLIANLLQSAGLSTGLFVSPHYFDVTERVRRNGVPVAAAELREALKRAGERAGGVGTELSRFDVLLAAAAELTADVDVFVAEAGIGGRLDATAALRGESIALTALDFEHTQLLGNTLEEIAIDKVQVSGAAVELGDISPDVVTALQVRFPSRVFRRAARLSTTLERLGVSPAVRHCLPLAVHTANQFLASRGLDKLADEQIAAAVGSFLPELRYEKVSNFPEIRVDVAHSPAAVRATSQFAAEAGTRVAVLGVAQDRDIAAVIEAVDRRLELVLTMASHRGCAVDDLWAAVATGCRAAHRAESVAEALALARELPAAHTGIVVLGSSFLAAEAACAARARPFKPNFAF